MEAVLKKKICGEDRLESVRKIPCSPDFINSDNEMPSPLMSLPKEIWTQIFSNVPQADRILHRLSSKEWCKNVDEFSTVDVNFTDDFPEQEHRKRVFELRIRSCTFTSLHVPFEPDFTNPLLVKEITFTTHVTASNVLRILSVCTNVESLRFLTTMSSETPFVVDHRTTSVLNNLKNLQNLEIGILTFLERNSAQISKTFSTIIGNENVYLPSLKTLSVAFTVRHVEWIELFKFVSRHSVTLKYLSAICPCGECPPSFPRIGDKSRKDVVVPNDLVLPQLETLIVSGSSECPYREDVFIMVDQQKRLGRYETDISRGTAFLKHIVERNQGTISVLKIHEIGNLYSDELNCEMFRECHLLQDLSLRFELGVVIVVNVGGSTSQSPIPVLYNLSALPNNLKRLTLCGSQILSNELAALFSRNGCLEEVTLGRAESPKVRNSGMTLSILITMFENMTRLNKFRIFLDMISKSESNDVEYCSELTGTWLEIWQISKDIMGANTSSNEMEEKCCADRYHNDSCLNHRPFIEIVFKSESSRTQSLKRFKVLERKGSSNEFTDET